MGHATEPRRITFDQKMVIRRAIKDANIPHAYVSVILFACFFVGNLPKMRTLNPPKEKVLIYGDGNVKGTDYINQVGLGHFYHIYYEGCLTNFEIGEKGVEATLLYPEVEYTRMDEYLKLYW
uniref:Uncharacterized protein n=1 Tax=Oryza punctata TaxID=4537 RepID=A0A0E0ML64_ORYPU